MFWKTSASPELYRVLVRSRKDGKALSKVFSTYYRGWPVGIHSLGGLRGLGELVGQVLEYHDVPRYVFLLLGRDDFRGTPFFIKKPNIVTYVTSKSKIRNHRLSELAWVFEKIRGFQRLCVFNKPRCPIHDPEPYHDIFLFQIGSAGSKLTGLPVGKYLVVRSLGGEHLFLGDRGFVGKMMLKPDLSRPRYYGKKTPMQVDVNNLIETNKDVIDAEERIVMSWLGSMAEKFDKAIVPWSGGKDSTVALYFALKIFGSEKVFAATVEMDTDMPGVRDFIAWAAGKLGVKNHVTARVSLREVIKKKGLPGINNRWCTGLKIEALGKLYDEICESGERCLIITGDRDVESEARNQRSPLRQASRNVVFISPLKQWSTLLLQLYIYYKGIPLNPLYEEGFYRLGCYMCPSLRNWEVNLMLNLKMWQWLINDEVFKMFLKERGGAGPVL